MASSDLIAPRGRDPTLALGSGKPVVACYCATFLRPEMLHIYRQLVALRAFRPVVIAQKRENADYFPFDALTLVRRSPARALRRVWHRQLLRRPVLLSRREVADTLEILVGQSARLLHVYFGHVAVRLLPLFARWNGPVVVSFHGADVLVELDRPAFRRAAIEVLARANLVVARSQSLIDALNALGCPPGKLRLHHAGIPLDEFPYRVREWPAHGEWRLLQSSRLIEKKGVATSLRAFAEFSRSHPRSTFTIAGEGALLGELRALSRALGVERRVEFTGFLPQQELAKRYRDAHLFLHPSLRGRDGNQEGVPNSLLEAMAVGLPVFATSHGGIPEAVRHGVNGWLTPEGDWRALAAGLIELTSQPERLAEMGRAASRTVENEFEQHAQAALLESYYHEALKGSARQQPGDPCTSSR